VFRSNKQRIICIFLSPLLAFAFWFGSIAVFQNVSYAASEDPGPVDDLFFKAVLSNTTTSLIVSADPASNQGVPVDSTITLYFTNGIQATTPSAVYGYLNCDLIQLEQVSGTQGSVQFTAVNQSGAGNQPIIITPDKLLPDTQYKLILQAGLTANNGQYTANGIVIGFTTKSQPPGAPTLTGALYTGSSVTLLGLPSNATDLEYRVAPNGSDFGNWNAVAVSGTTATVECSGILTGTAKVQVRAKESDTANAGASASETIYAALDCDIPLVQGIPVVYEGGLKVYPDQLQSGGVNTVNVRNANSEVPGVPNGLLPKSGLAPVFYGVNVKGPDGPNTSKVIVSLPLGYLKDYDIEKVSAYRLDMTWKEYSNWWMPMLETDKSEINDQIIKVALWNFDSKGIDEVLGVFENPIYMTNTIYTQLVSQTDTTVTLRVGSPSFGVAKFKIYRDGQYIGDNTGPIVQRSQTENFEANFTDTPPGPGTYVYNATAVDYSGNEHLSGITYGTTSDRNDATVVFGSGQDDAASVIATVKAGLEDGSIFLGFEDGDSVNSVTQNIDLPLSPMPNSHITWTSNRPDVFKDKNTSTDLKALFGRDSNILKPADTNDVSLVLTATITSELDNNYSSDTIDIPITVRWTSVAHVAGPEEIKRALNNSVVQTVIIDSWGYSPDGLGSTDGTLSGTYDCQGKTIRGWAILENGTVLKNAVVDAYGKYYSAKANPAPFIVVGGATFDNVTFTGLENSNFAVDFRMQDYYKTANIQITNCNFGAAKKGAINIDENQDKVRYDLNAAPSTITISNNIFKGEGKPGYAIRDFLGIATIEDNTITGYQGSIDNLPSAGIFLSQDIITEVSGNTITDCDNGIMVWTREALTYQKYNSNTGEYTYKTVTSYAKVNGSDIIDGSSAEAAGKKLLSANLITPAEGDGNSAVIFSNAADSNNPLLLYKDINGTKLPPTVTVDTMDNAVNQDIELTFNQDATWENAITNVKVDGNALINILNSNQYNISAGKIQILGSIFDEAKDYDISIEAEGYAPAILTQTVKETSLKTPPTLATTTFLVSPLGGYPSDPIVDINFADDPAWRSAISGVTVSSMSANADNHQHACSFSSAEGKLNVSLPYNQTGFTIIITVQATGYADAKLTMVTYRSGPVLSPDTSGNSVGQDIDVYFDPYEYMNWTSYITDVKVDNVSLNVSQCKATWGSIHIDGSVFTKAGTYTITVNSGVPRGLHFVDTTFQQEIVAGTSTQTILRAQSLDNYLGKDITLTFTDNQTWREAIKGAYLNGVLIDSSLYFISEGQIKLDNKVFSAAGTYTITVKATGFDDVSVTQLIAPAAVNLAPQVRDDTTDTMVSRALDLAFSDNAAWRAAIVGITYYLGTGEDQTTEYVVPADKYTIEAGNIHIEPNVFPGLVYVHIKATGYSDAVVRQSLYTGDGTPLNPATLLADTTDNVLGQVIELTFHDADWRKYISNVAVNNTTLTSDQYMVSAGKISINSNAFSKSGTYIITISAANLYDFTYGDKYYPDASVSQTILAPKYTLTVVQDSIYTPSVVNGINVMTVNSSISGFRYFTVKTTPVNAYYTKPMVVFVQFRNNSQIAISSTSVASAESDNAVAGFNVETGDVIKAYVVDGLTNDTNINPNILQ